MNHLLRNLVFALFVATFLIGAPLIVLYTAGYRYNPVNGQIVRTGVLAVSSVPVGAAITLSGTATGKKTPYVFNRVMPGDYTVALSRDGYHSWQHEASVSTGRTSYINNVLLFLNEPLNFLTALEGDSPTVSVNGQHIATVVRTDSGASVWRYTVGETAPKMITQYPAKLSDELRLTWSADSEYLTLANIDQNITITFNLEGIAITAPEPITTPSQHVVGPAKLVVNTQAVEVRDARQPDAPLVALLPLADYRVAEVSDAYAVIVGTNHMLYLLDFDAANPIVLSATGDIYDLDTTLNRFAWSDGSELSTYDISSGTNTFVTRQSKPILSIHWQGEYDTLIVTSNNDVTAFSLNDTEKTTTTLLDQITISSFWLHNSGTYGYLYGNRSDQSGIYTLPLTR